MSARGQYSIGSGHLLDFGGPGAAGVYYLLLFFIFGSLIDGFFEAG